MSQERVLINARRLVQEAVGIVEEVVTEYNVLRKAIQTLAERHGISLQGWAARIVNRVLDRAIGLAVKTYATQKALEVQQRRHEHLSFVVHDL